MLNIFGVRSGRSGDGLVRSSRTVTDYPQGEPKKERGSGSSALRKKIPPREMQIGFL